MKSKMSPRPIMIAHRGDTSHFPENTIPAFDSAFAKNADGIEFDIHLFRGEIIVVHDYLFSWGSRYPVLGEVLKKFSDKGRIEIEIKSYNTNILKPLKHILLQFPNSDIELTTSEIPLAPHIKSCFPSIPLGLILQEFLFPPWMNPELVYSKLIGWGQLTQSTTIHIPFQIIIDFGQNDLINKLHKRKFIVHSHIFNTPKQHQQLSDLIDWQVDQCTFDDIDLLNHRKSQELN